MRARYSVEISIRSCFVIPALVLSLLAALVPGPSLADSRRIADPTDQSDSPTDIAAVGHDHGSGKNILRHEVHFDGEPRSVSEAVSLLFRFRNQRGMKIWRKLTVATNPDGGLYGVFRNRRDEVMGFSRAWMDDASTLVVEFSIRTLGRLRRDRYRWHVRSILGAGEFDEPCAAEDTGPPVCQDRAPTEGWIKHRL